MNLEVFSLKPEISTFDVIIVWAKSAYRDGRNSIRISHMIFMFQKLFHTEMSPGKQ